MTPAGSAAIPAVDADRLRMAEETGRVAASLIGADHLRPSRIMTEPAFENALRAAAGNRRIDQRDHPSYRDRRAARRRDQP